jgi:phage tail-like protein
MIRKGSISVGKSQTSHTTLPAFLFMVEYANQVRAVFSECSGLTAEIDVFEYQEGGENTHVHKLPGHRKWSNITLKRGMTDSLDLWNWWQRVIAGGPNLRHNISIILNDETQKRGMRWNIEGAYPIKWEGPSMRVDGNTVAIETLVLAHNGFVMLKHGGG